MHESVRAAWVVRDEIESPEAIKGVIRRAAQLGLNTLVVQVRGRGVAYYRSEIEPWHPAMNTFGFDPLALLLEEAEGAGIAVQAWINALFTWSEPHDNLPEGHVFRRHPDWAMAGVDGQSVLTLSAEEFREAQPLEGAYLCPSRSEVRDYLADVYAEAVVKYPVEAVHLDYIRYASPKLCFCDHCLSLFSERHGGSANALRAALQSGDVAGGIRTAYDEWRRELVDATVAGLTSRVRAEAPGVLITSSVFPGREDAFNQRFQDWVGWCRRGYVDALFPMAYSPETATVTRQVEQMLASVPAFLVVVGIGAYKQSPAQALEKIRMVRDLGVRGFCCFAMKTLLSTEWDALATV